MTPKDNELHGVTSELFREFGYAVCKARIDQGWSMEKLAEMALGNPDRKGYVSRVEKGKKRLSPETIDKFAHALDLPETVTKPVMMAPPPETPEPEETKVDRDAVRLLRIAAKDETAPDTAEALLIALAYEYATGDQLDLFSAYKDLRAALEAAAKIRARGQLPDNTGGQLKAVLAEVARLNDLGDVDGAANALDDALARVEQEYEAIFDQQLNQDRLRNRPADAAKRHVANFHRQAPAGGVWKATHDLLLELRKRGKKEGDTFDLRLALELAKINWEKARGPQKGQALSDIGNCHFLLGERSADNRHLRIAIKAFRECIKFLSKKTDPEYWASNQDDLGLALALLAEREDDTKFLQEALLAFNKALTVPKKDRLQINWAIAQADRGYALLVLGKQENNSARLSEALQAYEKSLAILKEDTEPMKWAMAQMNRGLAFRWLGQFEREVSYLDRAAAAYDSISQIQTRNSDPFDWAKTQWNLADLALARHGLVPDPALPMAARAYVMAAREVFAEGSEHQTERCDELLAQIDAAEAKL